MTTCLLPLSITAEFGTVTTEAAPATGMSTSANIAGFKRPLGLASSIRTGTVRVSAFSVG